MSEQPSPLEFLRAVYLNNDLPLSVRMRAAIECAPYEHPKLTAIATTTLNGNDFAAMLDRAIARSRNPPPMIEHRPSETVPGVQWSGPIGGGNDE